jgi:hypothetical protein
MPSYPSDGDTSQAGCEGLARAAQSPLAPLRARRGLRRGFWPAAACWLIALLCAPVRAADDYDSLLNRALAAHAVGEFEQAHALFTQAHALAPNARTLRGMGVASYQAGNMVRAVGELEEALAHPEKPLEGELRSAAQRLLERARAQVGMVELRVAPATAVLRVDGEAEARAVSVPLVLAPGSHRLHFSAEGHLEQQLELRIAPGAGQILSVRLVPAPPAVAQAAARPPPGPADASRAAWQVRAAWTTLGVAAGAGIVAGALFLTAHTRVARIADACAETAAQQCTTEERDAQLAHGRIDGLERGVNASLGVAGAALVVGAGVLIAWRVRGKRGPRDAAASSRLLHGTF